MARYGWDRDELYFLAAARHPAFGYVDFPPVTAWIGWLVVNTAGASLVALRRPADRGRGGGGAGRADRPRAGRRRRRPGAGGRCVGADAVRPRRGDDLPPDAVRRADVAGGAVRRAADRCPSGAEAVAAAGRARGASGWRPSTRSWCCSPAWRRLGRVARAPAYRTRGPWIAALIAAMLMVPNLAWQAANGWPSVAFYPSQQAKTAGDASPAVFVLQSVAFLGAAWVLVVVGISRSGGGRCCGRSPWCRCWQRWSSSSSADASYYPLPADGWRPRPVRSSPPGGSRCPAAAAGSRSPPSWRPRARAVVRRAAGRPGAQRAVGRVLRCLGLVVLRRRDRLAGVRRTDGAGLAVAAAVGARRRGGGRPELRRGGRPRPYRRCGGLPQPLSGHLSWQYWRPARCPSGTCLPSASTAGLDRLCTSRARSAASGSRGIDNDEQGRLIAWCTLRAPLGELW